MHKGNLDPSKPDVPSDYGAFHGSPFGPAELGTQPQYVRFMTAVDAKYLAERPLEFPNEQFDKFALSMTVLEKAYAQSELRGSHRRQEPAPQKICDTTGCGGAGFGRLRSVSKVVENLSASHTPRTPEAPAAHSSLVIPDCRIRHRRIF